MLTALAIAVLGLLALQGTPTLVYTLYPGGVLTLTITMAATPPETCIKLLDTPLLGQVYAYGPQGKPIPATVEGSKLCVYPLENGSSQIVVEMVLQSVEPVANNTVEIELHPAYRATLYLPQNSTLLGVSPSSGWAIRSWGNGLVIDLSPGNYTLIISLPTPMRGLTAITHTTKTEERGPSVNPLYAAYIAAALIALAIALRLTRSRRAREEMEYPVNGRDIEILSAVAQGAKSLSEIAKRIGVSKSTVWRRVQRLEKLGLLEIVRESGRQELKLTEAGRKVLEKHRPLR